MLPSEEYKHLPQTFQNGAKGEYANPRHRASEFPNQASEGEDNGSETSRKKLLKNVGMGENL